MIQDSAQLERSAVVQDLMGKQYHDARQCTTLTKKGAVEHDLTGRQYHDPRQCKTLRKKKVL